MSAIFMKRHRFSTINPDDIAGVRLNLNSVTFSKTPEEEVEEIEEIKQARLDDEESKIGVPVSDGKSPKENRFAIDKKSVSKKLKKKWQKIKRHSAFKHILPILVLIIYSIVGALVFSAVEMPNAMEKRHEMLVALHQNRMWTADSLILSLKLENDSRTYELVWDILEKSDANNSIPADETITWNIWGSLFFVGTLYTTIGFGNIYPETSLGRALTIIYAFFGVPLVLSILSDLGQLLCSWISKAWRILVNRVPALKKREDERSDIPLPQSGMPITLCLLITLSWLLICSALFCIWERNWTYFNAFYFFFISLSTIGLGDVMPDEPKVLIFNFWLVIIGLSLVTMTLGVVQEHITLFLYRMMIELQKECRARLSIGNDVEKDELLEKIWDKQPWYVRQFAPMFVSENESQKLENFAGTAITDTAVQMGIIPAPPGYQPLQITPTLVQTPECIVPGVAAASAPLVMSMKAQPTVLVQKADETLGESSTIPQEPQTESDKTHAVSALYPGGNVVVKLSKTPSPLQTAISLDDAQEKVAKALKTRVAFTQTDNTDNQTAKRLCSMSAQTDDDYCEKISILTSSTSLEEDFESALETKSYQPPTPSFSSLSSVRYASKSVQTAPTNVRWPSQISNSSVEIQTTIVHHRTVEIQTLALVNSDVEVQCELQALSDEESQTSRQRQNETADAATSGTQPDLLPRQWSDFEDKGVQVSGTTSHREIEIQTGATSIESIETQTECPEFENEETQTDGTSQKWKVQSQASSDDEDLEDENLLTVPRARVGAWQYSSWVTNIEKNSLGSLPEGDEDLDEEMEEDEPMEDEEDDDTDALDTHAFSEENEPSEGIDLPAITIRNQDDDLIDDSWPFEQRKNRSGLQDELIFASMATQTEELIVRRQSFPKDMFTTRLIGDKIVFPANEDNKCLVCHHDSSFEAFEKNRSNSLLGWILKKRRPSKQDHKQVGLCNASVQTESEMTRDIQIQTDESYLLKAKKFEDLRCHRAGSLAVSVAPHLKRRLHRIAADAQRNASIPTNANEKKPQKATTSPKLK